MKSFKFHFIAKWGVVKLLKPPILWLEERVRIWATLSQKFYFFTLKLYKVAEKREHPLVSFLSERGKVKHKKYLTFLGHHLLF